jgi:uncharacterized damage-inducible protein DinB
MLSKSISELFKRDLPRVKKEVEAYSSEELLWKVIDGTKNSGGTLALHLAGNLQHFFGAVLNDSGYVRNREFEFSGQVSRQELLKELDAALESVLNTLDSMSDEELQAVYPKPPFETDMSCVEFLTFLYGHLNYHLGQLNYHRRILDTTS